MITPTSRFGLRAAGWETKTGNEWEDPRTGQVHEYDKAAAIQGRRDFDNDPERLKAEAMDRIADALSEIAKAIKHTA